ncbi:MAG: hypothetical protein II309_03640 [Bacilli bacterium]|nr:hypothetical protein [Bacilli bacterium]
MFEKVSKFFKEKVGINLDVRFQNPQYWFMLGTAVILPMATYMGLNATDITSWSTLGNMFTEAIKNPYLLVMVIANVYNATVDGTTKGFKDSQMMLNGETSTDLMHEIEELKEIIKDLNKDEE